ncbi:Metabotropic glutamate receptor 1 [Terramyces sp. JEL0728]|nr:Metabotropic glutamate receptor 1 [Terramyces sp. JEL0728]
MNIQADASLIQVAKWSNGVEYQLQPYYYPGGASYKPADAIDPTTVADYLQSSGDPLGILSIALFLIGVIVSLTTILGTLIYRNHPMIRASDVFVGFAMQLCIFIAWFDLLTMVGKPTVATCTIDSVILPICFAVYYGLMFMKNYRLYMIFTNPTKYIFNTYATIAIGFIFGIPSAIIIAIWNAQDAPRPAAHAVVKGTYAWTCSSSSTSYQSGIVAALAMYSAVILVLNLLIAFKTRNVPSKYSETKIVLFAISILLTNGLGFRLKAGVKMIAEFYLLIFNLISSFSLKISYCVQGNVVSMRSFGRSSNNRTGKSTDGKPEEKPKVKKATSGTAVILRKPGFFSDSKPRNMVSETANIVSFCRLTKLTLEDETATKRGDGEVWKLGNLQAFKSDSVSPTLRRYFLDNEVFEITYETPENAKEWDSYFHSWSNIHMSMSMVEGTKFK